MIRELITLISLGGLGKIKKDDSIENISLRYDFIDGDAIDLWFHSYLARLALESLDDLARRKLMNNVNPKYILRNHLAQRAIELAQNDDFSEVRKLLNILNNPYDEQLEHEFYAQAPAANLQPTPISCSS